MTLGISPGTKAFHAHLDVCKQCANNPFRLCATGDRLLVEAAKESLNRGKDERRQQNG